MLKDKKRGFLAHESTKIYIKEIQWILSLLVGLITADQEDEKAKAEAIDELMESLIGSDEELDDEEGDE